tara:strand:- start:381 stop:695 length:315 start_codon:yes stop_codon:yes gene_type:complete
MSDINQQPNFSGTPGPFSGNDGSESLVSDISNIMKSTPATELPSHLKASAKQAGQMAANAKTVEDKQNIYKSYLTKSNQANQETTRKMVKDWENTAEYYRTNKK